MKPSSALVERTYKLSEQPQEFKPGANFEDKIFDSILVDEKKCLLIYVFIWKTENNMSNKSRQLWTSHQTLFDYQANK